MWVISFLSLVSFVYFLNLEEGPQKKYSHSEKMLHNKLPIGCMVSEIKSTSKGIMRQRERKENANTKEFVVFEWFYHLSGSKENSLEILRLAMWRLKDVSDNIKYLVMIYQNLYN